MTRAAAWVRRRWWVVLIVIALIVALGLGLALSLYQLAKTEPLMLQADALPIGEARLVRQREILQFQVDNLAKIWTTIVQVVVGVVLAVGAVATWRNLKATLDKLEVDRQAQITNRFTQAIGQLGAMKDKEPNLEVRLGGIYALERIAKDSPRDHWTIMEVLTTYVRQNARWVPLPDDVLPSQQELLESPKPRVDIQAVLTVIGRRVLPEDRPEPGRLDFHETDLRGADLTAAYLAGASFKRAYMEGVTLRRAHLEAADFSNAQLAGANLRSAELELARLTRANLRGADLSGAKLRGSDFTGAHLENAVFWTALVVDAHFAHAYLDNTDFSSARGLTPEQLADAFHHGDGAVL